MICILNLVNSIFFSYIQNTSKSKTSNNYFFSMFFFFTIMVEVKANHKKENAYLPLSQEAMPGGNGEDMRPPNCTDFFLSG